MKHDYFTLPGFSFRLRPCSLSIALFLLIFLLNVSFGFGQHPETTPPEYDWYDDINLPSIGLSNLITDDIVVASDIDSSGIIYILTFGNGVKKRNPEGGSPEVFIPGNQFESPLDLEIDSQGNVYVADYFAQDDGEDNGKVKVYSPEGNYLRTIFTDFYRPVGLAIDNEDNIYVAEYNDAKQGPEQDQVLSRLSIYDSIGGIIDRTDENLEAPYRVAVDSNQRVFISQAGDGNPQVLIFNSDLDYQGVMPGIDSPGSIVIDKFDFIHIVEYSGRVDFIEFLTISDAGDAIAIAGDIYEGIQKEVFFIRIFDKSLNAVGIEKDRLEFPLDIAFNDCAKMIVLNSDVEGVSLGFFIPTNLYFSLEFFNRTPSFDTENPIALCKSGLDFTLENGEVTITAEEIDGGSTDNCEIAEMDISPSVFTETGTKNVTLTVTDNNGNTNTCIAQVNILPGDEVDPEVTCPSNSELDPLSLDQNCDYRLPEFEAIIETKNFDDLNFQITENRIDNILNVEVEVLEGSQLIETCELQFELVDKTPPIITCPQNITGKIPAGEDSIEINYTLPSVLDNCSQNLVPELISGPESGSEFQEGTYKIEFEVTDEANNTETCDFTITVSQAEAQPEVTCPSNAELAPLSLDQNCDYELPNWTDIIETENFDDLDFSVSENRIDNILNVEVEVLEGSQLIETCELQFELVDETPPIITCPQNITKKIPEGDTSITIYYNLPVVSDNCSQNLVPELISGPESGSEFQEGTYKVEFEVVDDAGLSVTCNFTITVTQVNPNAPEIDCVNHELFLDENGQAVLNPGDLLVGEPGNLIITADKVNFDCTNLGANDVILTATDPETGLSSTCSTNIFIIDDIFPVASCKIDYKVYLDNSGNATLAPEDLNNNSTDNCGIVSMALSQTEFTRADLGEVPIILTVRDEAGNMDSCETTVEVVEEASGNFECRESIVVYLDENGEAGLGLEELYTGDTSGITLEASQLRFNCKDVGKVSVQLDYSGAQTGNCSISVEVRDEIAPEIITDVVELSLDAEGFAYLEENDVLVQDNCSREFVYRFGKSVFSCEDVGSNTINVEVEDINGNIATKNIEVRVNGEACKTPDDLKFLFIYPNPNNGIFTIVTPDGMTVEKVRVFDSRGRYILQQNYNVSGRFYRMSIEAVAESVYTLQIFTNKGIVVKRVIVSR
ncbi:HYR domain-containing protein [Salegentibacter maritimus]|uniref:HYR domain-containing protein n=1 Tax=Salegentibacter maritimus TaxID=2794347 RepID=UPI0018E47BA6|nr:HYR domain-containing protein [Salegentibacter maritimus]MBI6116471.1 HYR domain-containing protein [Salegentibacter maritimus]